MERRQFIAATTTSSLFLSGCTGVLGNRSEQPETSEKKQGVVNTDIRFTDIVAQEDTAFDYRRGRNERAVGQLEQLKEQGTVPIAELMQIPDPSIVNSVSTGKYGGFGLVVFDSNGDGSLDIFVPNSAGNPHHFYRNKLADTGELEFAEVADEIGVAAPEQDGYGAAAADIDNDGHRELFVCSPPGEYHRVFDNDGDGTFTDISDQVGIQSEGGHLVSFGDIDNDGRVDIFLGTVRNDWEEYVPYQSDRLPLEGYARNRLLKNEGDHRFVDVSEESGIKEMDGIPPNAGGTRTLAVAMIDIDQDGEIEIMHGDDQMIPDAESEIPGEGGTDWGMVHLFDNDGDGNFTDMMTDYDLVPDSVISNMGFAYGDFNYDGRLDFLTTAFGDYFPAYEDGELVRGRDTTKWFLQQPDGSFQTYGLARLVALPFGWGAAAFDYDNDGYTDLIYHGGMEFTPTHMAIGTNPGVIMHGLGHGMFAFDEAATTSSGTDHCRRMVYPLAVGDLNKNGYPDIVTASNEDVAPDSELEDIDLEYGGPLDDYAKGNRVFEPNEDGETVSYTGFDFVDGSLSVEINDGGTDNNWIAVTPAGGMGVSPKCGVNRDGIGAVITCSPEGMEQSATQAVTAGSSYGSSHSLEKTFGLADAESTTVEILWPGGVRNRLHEVDPAERITFPEIPVDFDADVDMRTYEETVETALADFSDAGVIGDEVVDRFRESAIRAFEE